MLDYAHERPHPAFAETFRAYSNYALDLAGMTGGRHGLAPSLTTSIHDAVLAHPPLHRVQRRPLPDAVSDEFETAMRKGWGFLRRVRHEVEDETLFDEEVNALLPYSAWYAVAHVGHAFMLASRQTVPKDHVGLLRG